MFPTADIQEINPFSPWHGFLFESVRVLAFLSVPEALALALAIHLHDTGAWRAYLY